MVEMSIPNAYKSILKNSCAFSNNEINASVEESFS